MVYILLIHAWFPRHVGSFTYTPTANYNGSDSFTYTANDGITNSNLATVSITVNPANDPPVATNDVYSTSANSTLVVIARGVLENDVDIDLDTLTAIKVTDPTHGLLILNPDGSFTYTPDLGYGGPDSFVYKAFDGTVDSNMVTVTIDVILWHVFLPLIKR